MVWCRYCVNHVPGSRYDGGLACDLCGRILENFNYFDDVTFVKNAVGQDQAAALKAANANNANCPEYARNLVEASKGSVAKSRKENQQKRAEEAKNAPPPATTMEAVSRMLEKKVMINNDVLEELIGTTSPVERSP